MKITKAQLKQIIREELSSLPERRRGGGFSISSAARLSNDHEDLRNRVHKYLIDKKFFKGRVLNGRHFIEIFWGQPEGPDVPAGAGYTNPARKFLISAVDSGDIDWATWEEIEPIWQEIDRSID